MIVNNEIEIKINSRDFILKTIDEKYNFINIGDILKIPIEYLSKNSHRIICATCDICGKTKNIKYYKYNENIKKYNYFSCSVKCATEKRKSTKKEKYGDENYNNPSKNKLTKKEKYGDENYNNPSKNKLTKKEKYGDENYINLDKMRQTTLNKYGVDSYSKTIEWKTSTK